MHISSACVQMHLLTSFGILSYSAARTFARSSFSRRSRSRALQSSRISLTFTSLTLASSLRLAIAPFFLR